MHEVVSGDHPKGPEAAHALETGLPAKFEKGTGELDKQRFTTRPILLGTAVNTIAGEDDMDYLEDLDGKWIMQSGGRYLICQSAPNTSTG